MERDNVKVVHRVKGDLWYNIGKTKKEDLDKNFSLALHLSTLAILLVTPGEEKRRVRDPEALVKKYFTYFNAKMR